MTISTTDALQVISTLSGPAANGGHALISVDTLSTASRVISELVHERDALLTAKSGGAAAHG